jgi:DNA repair protein RadC
MTQQIITAASPFDISMHDHIMVGKVGTPELERIKIDLNRPAPACS